MQGFYRGLTESERAGGASSDDGKDPGRPRTQVLWTVVPGSSCSCHWKQEMNSSHLFCVCVTHNPKLQKGQLDWIRLGLPVGHG